MTYINIAKPTGTPYTNLAKDPIDVPLYGSAIYGVNKYGIQSGYTNLPKPTGATTLRAGRATGLLMPLTYSQATTVGNPYTNVNKPT